MALTPRDASNPGPLRSEVVRSTSAKITPPEPEAVLFKNDVSEISRRFELYCPADISPVLQKGTVALYSHIAEINNPAAITVAGSRSKATEIIAKSCTSHTPKVPSTTAPTASDANVKLPISEPIQRLKSEQYQHAQTFSLILCRNNTDTNGIWYRQEIIQQFHNLTFFP